MLTFYSQRCENTTHSLNLICLSVNLFLINFIYLLHVWRVYCWQIYLIAALHSLRRIYSYM